MKILCITNLFPLPNDRGGTVRVLGLLDAMAPGHDLHILALARATDGTHASELAERLEATVELFEPSPLPRSRTARWIGAIRAGMPPWIAGERSEALTRRVDELTPAVDVVVVLDDFAGLYLDWIDRRTSVVIDKHNVLGASAHVEARAEPGTIARLRAPLAVRLSRRFERHTLRRADAVVVTSDLEDRRLRALYGRGADAVVPSAIDLPPPCPPPPGSRAVGWLGLLEYRPNARGLLRFVEEAWEPLGREGYELHVAGAGASASVRALERLPGVRVLGYVERLDKFFGKLGAAVVPLWAGPGIKLKTLTLLGAGIPVAATRVAVEGIAVEDGHHCLIADTPAELAAALRKIIGNRALAERLGEEGRRLVAERYTWEVVAPVFVEAVERAAGAARASIP